LSVEQATGSSE